MKDSGLFLLILFSMESENSVDILFLLKRRTWRGINNNMLTAFSSTYQVSEGILHT